MRRVLPQLGIRLLPLSVVIACQSDPTASPDNGRGHADTPVPQMDAGSIGGVMLSPDIAASRPGATIQFSALVRDNSGGATSEPVQYRSTCGSVTASGSYTAPLTGNPNCLVIVTAGDQADTTDVVGLPDQGIPLGSFSIWSSPTTMQRAGAAPFRASHQAIGPDQLLRQISAARKLGIHLILAMTGGSHEVYKTKGVFDPGKWQAAMDTYNRPDIQAAVKDGVADGTILGNSVMDEPQQADRGTAYRVKSWGPKGTMTKARVDGLCAYVKHIFPTLPAGVFHSPLAFEPANSYQVCDFLMAQYDMIKGDVAAYRDAAVTLTRRDGMGLILGLNILNGGKQDKDGTWDCAGTGGRGTSAPNCAMTSEQIRDFGKLLGASACALVVWRYNATFMVKPANQAALADVAITLSRLGRVSCGR